MVLMTLPVKGTFDLHIGRLFKISEGSHNSRLPLASISHFAFHPEKPAQSHWLGMVVALSAEPWGVAQPRVQAESSQQGAVSV